MLVLRVIIDQSPSTRLVYRRALIIFHARYWALSSVVRAADS